MSELYVEYGEFDRKLPGKVMKSICNLFIRMI